MPYVFSTLTCDNRYTFYSNGGADIKVPERGILIKGGTGVMNDRLITPMGVATEVTEEELKALKGHPIFKDHMTDGFISVQAKKADPEKVASDMRSQDGSAPITPSSYTNNESSNPEALTVTTNKE